MQALSREPGQSHARRRALQTRPAHPAATGGNQAQDHRAATQNALAACRRADLNLQSRPIRRAPPHERSKSTRHHVLSPRPHNTRPAVLNDQVGNRFANLALGGQRVAGVDLIRRQRDVTVDLDQLATFELGSNAVASNGADHGHMLDCRNDDVSVIGSEMRQRLGSGLTKVGPQQPVRIGLLSPGDDEHAGELGDRQLPLCQQPGSHNPDYLHLVDLLSAHPDYVGGRVHRHYRGAASSASRRDPALNGIGVAEAWGATIDSTAAMAAGHITGRQVARLLPRLPRHGVLGPWI